MSAEIIDAIEKLSKPWATWRDEAKGFSFPAEHIAAYLATVEGDSLEAKICAEFTVGGAGVSPAVAEGVVGAGAVPPAEAGLA